MIQRALAATAFIALAAESGSWAQDEGKKFRLDPQEERSETEPVLEELPRRTLPGGDQLLAKARYLPAEAEFIRSLARLPELGERKSPAGSLIEKHLGKKAASIETDLCRIECDWLEPRALDLVARLVAKAEEVMKDLFGTTRDRKVAILLVREKEPYLALVEKMAPDPESRKTAPLVGVTDAGEFRVGYCRTFTEAATLIMAETVLHRCPRTLWYQDPIIQGFQAYLTAFATGDTTCYISLKGTSPFGGKGGTAETLFRTAKAVLADPKHDPLGAILKGDLNSITEERWSVCFALVDYLVRKKRTGWRTFSRILEEKSLDGNSLRPKEERDLARAQALKEAFGVSPEELEAELKALSQFSYDQKEEELIMLVGLDKELTKADLEAFKRTCQDLRAGKVPNDRDTALYFDVQRVIDRRLAGHTSKFIRFRSDFSLSTFRTPDGQLLNYRLFVPKAYVRGTKIPLVVFLHGENERGNDNVAQLEQGVELLADHPLQAKAPCLILAPQCPEEGRWSELKGGALKLPPKPTPLLGTVLEKIGFLEREYTIDPQRIYLVGYDMGAFGAIELLSRNPKRFGGAILISGAGDPGEAAAASKTALWIFHGEKDEVFPLDSTRKWVQALKKFGGHPKVSELPGVGHAAWEKAFAEPKLWPWLLSQARP